MQVFLPPQEHRQPGHHADAGQPETVRPAPAFADVAAHQRGEQRTEIDAGIEQREARIAARVVFRIQLAHDGGDVGLEETHADDDQRQRQVGHAQRGLVADDQPVGAAHGFVAFRRHAEVAEDQQQAAEHHRLAHAQPTVGHQPADHRHAVHQPAVGAEQIQPGLVAEQVVLGQVEQQQRLHAVEGEALPHLGEEGDVHALGMAEEIVGGGQGGGRGHGRKRHARGRCKAASIGRAGLASAGQHGAARWTWVVTGDSVARLSVSVQFP